MLGWWLMMKTLNPFVDDAAQKMFTLDYHDDNPFLAVTVTEKLSPRAIVEAAVRAELGTELARPLGSPVVLSPWHKILLNPRQLFQIPENDYKKIDTKTVIGSRAKKPLKLEIPIIITAMSHGGSLSSKMKIALAKGASIAGTATNTGESAVIDNEREAAEFLIGQYNRGGWLNTPEQLKRVDAIEVQLGQGAWGGAIDEIMPAKSIEKYIKEAWHVKDNEDAIIHARMPGISSSQDIINLINKLKSEYDVPVGIKIAGTDFIEEELKVISQTEADFITIDGSEGGTSSAYPTLEDDVGLPTLYSLARAISWLEDNNSRNKFDVIITGGLSTPGHFLKAMALGADAVYIGTIALFAAIQTQAIKAIPSKTPVQLALHMGKLKDKLDVDEAAAHLANFLKSSVTEMKYAAQATCKRSIKELSKDDLVTVDKDLAELLRIRYAGHPRK
ncbi:MAG: hypothetical protein ACD_20C00051G0005 [uncultured bacterium]|nr:MAG: hypothetical protein ACD_20C00051G0005 [uncultured bacterium]HBH19280.1 FMN-binding glutamate synthase family protein [Cyanobacteria bacterium UBA9579]